MMKRFATTVVALTAFATIANASDDDWSVGQAIDATIADAVIPMFERYEQVAKQNAQTISALCATPSAEALSSVRDKFGGLVEAWGHVELMRLGPLMQDNRLERTLFWPDRKGRGLRQVRLAVTRQQEAVTNVETLAKQSVAVQGLLALEYVLFAEDSDTLATAGSADHRCAYVVAISQNLAQIAERLLAGWNADDGIASLWRNPSADNPLFRDESEQLRALLKLIGDGSEAMRVQRLDPYLNGEPLKASRALFWRSANTVASLRGNVDGLAAIIDAAQPGRLLDGNNQRLVDGMSFELSNAKRTLALIDVPLSDITAGDEAFDQLNYVRIILQSVYDLAGKRVPAIFGLTSGFSSLDGD